MSLGDALALLVSIAAAILAYRAHRKSDRTASEQTDLQRRLLTIENARERDRRRDAARADLRATIRAMGRSEWPQLLVWNEGAGAARAVDIKVDGKPATESEYLLIHEPLADELAPGASTMCHVYVVTGTPMTLEIKLGVANSRAHGGITTVRNGSPSLSLGVAALTFLRSSPMVAMTRRALIAIAAASTPVAVDAQAVNEEVRVSTRCGRCVQVRVARGFPSARPSSLCPGRTRSKTRSSMPLASRSAGATTAAVPQCGQSRPRAAYFSTWCA